VDIYFRGFPNLCEQPSVDVKLLHDEHSEVCQANFCRQFLSSFLGHNRILTNTTTQAMLSKFQQPLPPSTLHPKQAITSLQIPNHNLCNDPTPLYQSSPCTTSHNITYTIYHVTQSKSHSIPAPLLSSLLRLHSL
jgi:hypothetical protein